MGNALKDQGNLNEAIKIYSKTTKIAPTLLILTYMGWFYKNKKLVKAKEAYKNVIKIKPDFADSYYNLGVILQDQGKLEGAIEAYQKVISFKPDYAEAHYNMAVIFKDQGIIDKAIDEFKRTISLNANHYKAFSNLFYLLSQIEPIDTKFCRN